MRRALRLKVGGLVTQGLATGPLLLALACSPNGSRSLEGDRELGSVSSAIVGPGLGNLSYATGELGQMVAAIEDAPPDDLTRGAHGNVVMVKGYLATLYTQDGGGSNGSFSFWDVSDPRNPQRAFEYNRPPGSKLREAHGFGLTNGYGGKTYLFAQSTQGFQVWDWTDPSNAFPVRDVVVPGVNGSDYGGAWWLHLQAPYVFLAGGSAGLFVYDASVDPAISAPAILQSLTNAELGIPRINQVHVVGNMMVVNYVENGSGSALLDISDPENPIVTSSDTQNPQIPYSTIFTGGKLAAAGKQSNTLSMFTITFDADGNPNGMVPYGVPTGTGLGPGGYLSVQDGFITAGFSTGFAKFDTRTLPIAQVLSGSPPAPYNSDTDFATILGNLMFVSNDHGEGSALVVHQTEPDTNGPRVTFVHPLDGSTNRSTKTRIGLTFSESVELDSLSTNSVIVRPIGGQPLAGRLSTQGGIVNFSPDQPLSANTTYEVIVPVGGVTDWVGNPIPESSPGDPNAFVSLFSTGSSVETGPAGCLLGPDSPAIVGSTVSFSVSGCTGQAPLTYSWDFGDGSPPTAFSTSTSASHSYSAPAHYTVIATVRADDGQTTSFNRTQTVIYPVTPSAPTRSSTIVHDGALGRVFVVNSDGDTIAAIDSAPPFSKRWEAPVGRHPRTLAQPTSGAEVWIVNRDSSDITLVNPVSGANSGHIALPPSSRPYAVAFDPAGTHAYVTLEGTGRLLRIQVSSRSITGDIPVVPRPRGLAVSADGNRIFVSRFISPDTGGEVREVDATTFSVSRTFVLPEDTTTVPSESDGPGLPNYVQSLAITPDGRGAWVPSKKDNIRRGTGPSSTGEPFTHDSRVRTIVSKLDLVGNTVDQSGRRDLNDSDLANAVVFSDIGDFAFVSAQGSNHIEVYDALSHNALASIAGTGLAPRGLVLVGNRLFVQNFMSRDVAVFDVSQAGGTNIFPRIATVPTQAVELLSGQVLLGKRIFYNAADPRMSLQSYTSCASCHLDGDHDGRVWDFTQFGEGVRNTISLFGRAGVAEQGPVHWTGNFDEIQDFENDIRGPAFGGEGFLSDGDFALTEQPLGTPKAGRNADLDALAAYVSSLNLTPSSPYRNADGTMTADALAGKALFESPGVGCADCHTGAELSDSALGVFHDVGTITPASGARLGQSLTGFDTPSLLGVWATAPYLHDGSARTLLDVLTTKNPSDQHGVTSGLSGAELGQLVAYLEQLDDSATEPGDPPLSVTIDFVSSGLPYDTTAAAVGTQYFIDRTYTIGDLSPTLIGGTLIRAANDDKNVTVSSHLSFSVNREVDVYVAMDKRTTSLPSWLTSYLQVAETWTGTDSGASPFLVFRKTYPAGQITLGGNLQAPAAGMSSHYSVIVVATGPAPPPEELYFEAEAGALTSPMTVQSHASASGGQYIVATGTGNATGSPPTSGRATWTFSVSQAGNYRVWGRVLAPNSSTDSFWVRIDQGTWVKWNEIPASGQFGWDDVHDADAGNQVVDFALSAGAHTLEVAYRERGTGLDRLFITNDASAVPTDAPPVAPDAPTNLMATGGENQIALSWNAVVGAASYKVRRSTTPGSGHAQIAEVTSSSYVDSSVAVGVEYFYVVRASNNVGDSNNSNEDSAIATAPPPPDPPSGLTATPGDGQVALAWNASQGAATYTVKRSTTPGGGYVIVQSGVVGTAFLDSGLSNLTTYYYVVSATNPSGESANSGEASATPESAPPPTFTSQDIGNVAASGSWSENGETHTILASGADIWSTADEFHFAYQPLSGDGEITARVVSVENTNAWAKAGVMIRESLSANSRNAMTFISASNGARFQRRASTGASSSSTATAARNETAPHWVRLNRTGNTFTGYVSSNGNSWTLVASETISMPSNVLVGLAVTSHADGVVCTAAFDNVSVKATVCTPDTCQAGQCGGIPDGCGGTLNCGSCGGGQVCVINQCCAPVTSCGTAECGSIPDGCGGTLSCGSCGAGETCSSNQCVAPTNQYIQFEAESGAGAGSSPMQLISDGGASGGIAIANLTSSSTSNPPNNGRVSYTFTANTSGEYAVWGRFRVGPATGADDSLWVRMDSGAWIQWNEMYTRLGNSSYEWEQVRNTPAGNAIMTFNLSPGSHTLEIAYRENGLRIDQFSITNDLSFTPSGPTSEPVTETIQFEAESGSGAGVAPMVFVSNASASGGRAINNLSGPNSNSSPPANGRVSFGFNVENGGVYDLWGRFLVGPDGGADDSLWIRVDSGSWIKWNNIDGRLGHSSFGWERVHDSDDGDTIVTFALAPGAHTLEIAYRESGLNIDEFQITSDPTFSPSGPSH